MCIREFAQVCFRSSLNDNCGRKAPRCSFANAEGDEKRGAGAATKARTSSGPSRGGSWQCGEEEEEERDKKKAKDKKKTIEKTGKKRRTNSTGKRT